MAHYFDRITFEPTPTRDALSDWYKTFGELSDCEVNRIQHALEYYRPHGGLGYFRFDPNDPKVVPNWITEDYIIRCVNDEKIKNLEWDLKSEAWFIHFGNLTTPPQFFTIGPRNEYTPYCKGSVYIPDPGTRVIIDRKIQEEKLR